MITPDELRKCAMSVYLAAEEKVADDISRHLKEAADTIYQQTELLRRAKVFLPELIACADECTRGSGLDTEDYLRLSEAQSQAEVLLPELEKALEVGK